MTSPKVGKDCFNADVTQAAIRFAKYHLPTIYPAFDPLYSHSAHAKDGFVSKIKQVSTSTYYLNELIIACKRMKVI